MIADFLLSFAVVVLSAAVIFLSFEVRDLNKVVFRSSDDLCSE